MNVSCAARLLAASALLCAACSGSPFRGGYAARELARPGAHVIARLVPSACHDSAGAELEPDFSTVELAQSGTGQPLLVEHRHGHALLVVDNFFASDSFLVFQVIVKSDRLVRQWRIPLDPGGSGLLQVGRQLTEQQRGSHFEAGLASTRLRCPLVTESR
jgi:hypothetical protein